jgi:hypothetical protein
MKSLVAHARSDVDSAELERLRQTLAPALGPLPVPVSALAPVHSKLTLASMLFIGIGAIGAGGIGLFAYVSSVHISAVPNGPAASVDRTVPTEVTMPRAVATVETTIPNDLQTANPPPETASPAESDIESLPRIQRPERPNHTRDRNSFAELSLIERARAELIRNPSAALEILNLHEQEFRRGTFVEERELLAIEALAALGRRRAALARHARFERRFPESVHHARLQELFAGGDP